MENIVKGLRDRCNMVGRSNIFVKRNPRRKE